MSLPVAIQLYSLRNELDRDFKGTLEEVKRMGYDGVEFAGLGNNSPETVEAWVDELGLTPISAHVAIEDFL
ncbi:MAG: sugar phosphate isomerase/epimerase, partial [Clostridia bacterium]|nr:sugar phosphate isomerase/epimerase [Clostridia bacterium]